MIVRPQTLASSERNCVHMHVEADILDGPERLSCLGKERQLLASTRTHLTLCTLNLSWATVTDWAECCKYTIMKLTIIYFKLRVSFAIVLK